MGVPCSGSQWRERKRERKSESTSPTLLWSKAPWPGLGHQCWDRTRQRVVAAEHGEREREAEVVVVVVVVWAAREAGDIRSRCLQP